MYTHHSHTASAGPNLLATERRLVSGCHCSTSYTARGADPLLPKCPTSYSWSFGRQRRSVHHVRHTGSGSLIARMGIKWMESFESKVEIPESKKAELEELLSNPTFCKQVATETNQDCPLKYTGMLFQPVPWSPATPKGMPEDFEKFHNDPDHVTINVPPNFLFQSKIFQPSRLCAIYQRQQ